ncbi:hypothetical protein RCT95_03510, partial [Escherichia marmotae]|nr:hypothetical protein [Escherichia marmotae]
EKQPWTETIWRQSLRGADFRNLALVIGASEGKESQWVRVELSDGKIHGHPISLDEFRRLTTP